MCSSTQLPIYLSITYLSTIYLFYFIDYLSARWLRKKSQPSHLNHRWDVLLKTQWPLWVTENISQCKLEMFPYSKVTSATPVQISVLFGSMSGVSLWRHLIPLSILGAQLVKSLPAMQETQVQSLDREDPLEEGMATHSSILACKIPWTEEPDGL